MLVNSNCMRDVIKYLQESLKTHSQIIDTDVKRSIPDYTKDDIYFVLSTLANHHGIVSKITNPGKPDSHMIISQIDIENCKILLNNAIWAEQQNNN